MSLFLSVSWFVYYPPSPIALTPSNISLPFSHLNDCSRFCLVVSKMGPIPGLTKHFQLPTSATHICGEEFEDFLPNRIQNFTNGCQERIQNSNFKLAFQILAIFLYFCLKKRHFVEDHDLKFQLKNGASLEYPDKSMCACQK